MTKWIVNSAILAQLRKTDPVAVTATVRYGSWTVGPPGNPPPEDPYAEPLASCKSLHDLRSAIAPYEWLLYDPESWDYTPPSEQQNPFDALAHAGQWAHRHGYQLISAPARDLANTCTIFPKLKDETITGWYLRTGIAAVAARYADGVSIQSQAETTSGRYEPMVRDAAIQVRAANPYALVLAGVSTRYGTAQQMAAAAQSVAQLTDGYWLNVPGPDPDISKAVAFLKLMAAT